MADSRPRSTPHGSLIPGEPETAWARRVRRERERAEYVAAHGNVCECCGGKGGDTRGLNEDHDHRTGKHRGWLCWKCNKILLMGWITPEWLRKAADYLEARS